MLVLSRKPGEQIQIGDAITIKVVRIGPNTVRLGIEAPRDMNIVRKELTQKTVTEPPNSDITIDLNDEITEVASFELLTLEVVA